MSVEGELKFLNDKLDHQHAMLHDLAGAVAGIARSLRGGMTPAETAAVTARLNAHAEALEKIVADNPVPVPDPKGP